MGDCEEIWNSSGDPLWDVFGRSRLAHPGRGVAGAPDFLVTFPLPAELRQMFFGPMAREAFDVFFAAVSIALSLSLALPKSVGASVCGFTAVLHAWTQQLLFHPPLQGIVPGAGPDANGCARRVQSPNSLVHLPILRAKFQQAFRDELYQVSTEIGKTNLSSESSLFFMHYMFNHQDLQKKRRGDFSQDHEGGHEGMPFRSSTRSAV